MIKIANNYINPDFVTKIQPLDPAEYTGHAAIICLSGSDPVVAKPEDPGLLSLLLMLGLNREEIEEFGVEIPKRGGL